MHTTDWKGWSLGPALLTLIQGLATEGVAFLDRGCAPLELLMVIGRGEPVFLCSYYCSVVPVSVLKTLSPFAIQ